MPGSGIWLPDDTYAQTQGQLWAQQQTQRIQAGQQWASQAMQDTMQRLQAMVPQVAAQPTPVPAQPPPTPPPPAPQPVTPTPMPTAPPPAQITPPAPAPTPAPPPPTIGPGAPGMAIPPTSAPTPPPPTPTPVTTTPTPTPNTQQTGMDWAQQQITNLLNPSTTAPSETDQAGTSWAQQQIQNLLNPAPAAPQPPQTQPGVPGLAQPPMPPAAPPSAPAPTPATTSSGAVPAGPQSSTPGDLIDQARQAAQNAGIDPEIFSRQIQQESGFNPNARSPAGAQGIAQFMPGTAQGLGIDPMNPVQALGAAAQMDAQNLQKYGGDWAKTLAAYNAGPGNVDKYGGVPPFQETQNYVDTILGGAKDVVQNAAQGAQNLVQGAQQAVSNAVTTGQTAVNTAVQGVQSAVARVSQFGMGLSSGDAMAFCGPAAAMAFAQTYGRNPTVDEAKQLAQQVGWNPQQGMAGVSSEVDLLKNLGVDAHATQGVDWSAVGRDASGGNPVIIDTPGHYYYIDGYNADTGQMHVGTSGTDLKGGSEWMTPDQINAMPQSQGAARAAIFADHPLAQQDGLAQSTAQAPPSANGPTYMGTLQPATPSEGPTPSGLPTGNPLQDLLNNASSAVQSKAQDTMNAVLNVGGSAPSASPDLNAALASKGTDLGGLLPDITGSLAVDPNTPLGQVVAGQPIGSLSPTDQAQALMQLNQQYEFSRALATQNVTGNLPVVSGLASFATDPEQLLALGLGGAAGEALLPGAGGLANLGRGALTGALGGAIYGAGQPSATPQNILQGAALGGALGGAGGLPGVLRGLGGGGAELAPEALENARGVGLDPLTGQEILPAGELSYGPHGVMIDPATGEEMAPEVSNSFQAAMDANPDATSFMRTPGNQFEPVVEPEAQPASDVLTGLQNLLTSRQPAAASTGLARLLGGGALGGYTGYQTTDPNDPNRWLKIAGAAGAGALAAGPGLEALTAGSPVVSQDVLQQLRTANLNQNVYQPAVRQGLLPQVADVTKQLLLSNPATHVGNLIGNTLEILRSPISLTLGGRPQDAIAGMTALGQAVPEAARNAWSALNGQQVATLGTAASRIPLSQPVYRVLGAADTFSRTLGEYQGLAERASQLLSRAGVSPSDPAAQGVLESNMTDLVAAARAQGARSVFQPVRDATQGTSFLDNLAHTYSQYKEGLLNSPNLGAQALGTLLDYELPFAGVPMRLLEVGAARAPGIAQVTGIGRALGAARAGDMPAMQRAIGETVLETGIQAMIAKGINDGNIVGPDNPDHPGGAIQIGGQWFNFDRMAGGFALPMQIMSGFAEAYNKAGLNYISPYAGQAVGVGPAQVDRGALDRAAQQTAAGLNAAMKPFASAVPGEALMNMLAAVGDGGTTQLIQQQAQDAIARVSQPGFARFMENVTDPVAREIQKSGPDSLWQPTAAAIPGLSALVPPKIDPTTGQPMPRTTTGLGQLIGAENPHLSALTQEANDLRMKYGYQVSPPSSYAQQITVGNAKVPLTPAEQQAVAQLSGQRMAQLSARLETPQYTSLPPLQRAIALQAVSRAADQLNVAAAYQVLGPQEFRQRVIQGVQLAGAPVMAQPQLFGPPSAAPSPMLQAALYQAMQPSASGLQALAASNQAGQNYARSLQPTG